MEIADGALIVGGGLASVDVAKLHMFELIRRALALRGLPFDCEAADKLGVDKILAQHDLAWDDLGIEGVTIFYRRRLEDMPLMTMPEGASAEKVAKVEAARVKIIERSIRKYRFKVEPLARPADVVVEDSQLVGVIFDRMTVEPDGVLKPTGEQFTRRGPYVVSSIGSIPEPLPERARIVVESPRRGLFAGAATGNSRATSASAWCTAPGLPFSKTRSQSARTSSIRSARESSAENTTTIACS